MELMKREEASKKNYAKKGELTKSELKSSTPKKWLVASALGVATLFYANPNSLFGSIGVVFGCISFQPYEFTTFGNILNTISGLSGKIYLTFLILDVIIAPLLYIKGLIIKYSKKESKKEWEKAQVADKKTFKIIIIITIVSALINVIWERWLSSIATPLFYDMTAGTQTFF